MLIQTHSSVSHVYACNMNILNPKKAGGQFDPFCGFSVNLSSKERSKPWFFVTFSIIISHIFPENFIKIPQIMKCFSINISYFRRFSSTFHRLLEIDCLTVA